MDNGEGTVKTAYVKQCEYCGRWPSGGEGDSANCRGCGSYIEPVHLPMGGMTFYTTNSSAPIYDPADFLDETWKRIELP